jgi:crotonobetainyl-CoA:carnitine CoA-transferase CaiB-like acyl-CoA transferase
MADPHFKARGVFDHVLTNETGARMTALPMPIASPFRTAPDTACAAPTLGQHNAEILS